MPYIIDRQFERRRYSFRTVSRNEFANNIVKTACIHHHNKADAVRQRGAARKVTRGRRRTVPILPIPDKYFTVYRGVCKSRRPSPPPARFADLQSVDNFRTVHVPIHTVGATLVVIVTLLSPLSSRRARRRRRSRLAGVAAAVGTTATGAASSSSGGFGSFLSL